jgi:hypothetical protein
MDGGPMVQAKAPARISTDSAVDGGDGAGEDACQRSSFHLVNILPQNHGKKQASKNKGFQA